MLGRRPHYPNRGYQWYNPLRDAFLPRNIARRQPPTNTPESMQGLAITLLGSPRITLDGLPVSFDTRKAVALLAYLACTRNRHSRDALATLFWPEYTDARNALRRTLSALQRALGPGWLEIDRNHIALVRRQDFYLDVTAFEAQTAPTASREILAQGLALYRDDFLAGFSLRDSIAFDEWQFFEAERLRQRCALGMERLAALHSAAADYAAAIDIARRRLALDPLDEAAHRMLMNLYVAAGQRAAALRQYRVCAQRLEQEFGATPAEETVQLYQAIQSAHIAAPQTHPPMAEMIQPVGVAGIHPAALPSNPPLVGRKAEQARLQACYANAGGGALAAITGQPGIGKTRLAEDLLALARNAGGSTLTARCYAGESTLAYAPIAALIRAALSALERQGRRATLSGALLAEIARLIPDLARDTERAEPQPLAGPEARRRFFEAMADLLFAACAGRSPGVILIDDAHWADSASLDLLAFLARRLDGRPVLLLLTWRDEETSADHPLHAIAGEARRTGSAELVALGPLDSIAVADLALSSGMTLPPTFSARLYSESEGLPFFVVEYLAVLREGGTLPEERDWPLPRRVRDLLEARLHPLSDPARMLLLAASAIGRAFDMPTLCATAAVTEDAAVDALDELLDRTLIIEATATPLRYAFGHERLRTLVYERISQARRRLLHRRVALYLATQLIAGQRSGLAAQVAYHAAAAGETTLAAIHHKLAGDEARALAANGEAVTHYTAALEFGNPEIATLHEALGDLLALAGDYSGALTHYDVALHSGIVGRSVVRKTGEIHYRLGAWQSAEARFAVVLNDPAASYAERALASAAWSLTARRRGDLALAARLADDALARATDANEPHALARAYGVAGALAAQQGFQNEALAHLERGLTFAAQVDDPETRIAALNSLALALAATDPARAIALAEEALTLCLARDDRHRAAALHNTLADLHHATGAADSAHAHLRAAVTLFAAIGHDQPAIWMLTEW